MFYYKVATSPNPQEAVGRLRRHFEDWVYSCVERYEHVAPLDEPQQVEFATACMLLLRHKPDQRLSHFLSRLRDKVELHYEAREIWHKGYWPVIEVGQGMKHFVHFLGEYWKHFPDDRLTVDSFLKGAQYLGNWDPNVPAWFDWELGLFRSVYLGTREVKEEMRYKMNLPVHFTCLEFALLAFQMGGEVRYLELAKVYGENWANAIVDSDRLPLALTPEGPIYDLPQGDESGVGELLGHEFIMEESDRVRAEHFLRHNAVALLLELWQFSERPVFLEAARRLLDVLIDEAVDVDAGAIATAVRHYRNFTGDCRYDDAILGYVEFSFPYCVECLALDTRGEAMVVSQGVGKRKDMPLWFENNYPRQHNPILLSLAAEISGNERLAARSLDLARGYFSLARMAFPDGRQHGGKARTVCAVAQGHDRENRAGMITQVLAPLMEIYT